MAALIDHWHPSGDWAAIELRTRDVGSAATPLIGPYSRFGWNHPGPILFWMLAVPYRLSGSSSSSLLFAAAMVNISAVAGIGFFAWRRGRLPLVAIASAGIALIIVNIGPGEMRDPWNPSLTILPLALFIIAAWSTHEGDRLAPVCVVVIGSFLVQSHIGFAPIVASLAALGLFRFIRVAHWHKPIAVSAALLVACWTPVLADQIIGTGNLMDLFRYFTTTGHPNAGVGEALGIVARELGGYAPWLGGREPADMLDGHLLTTSAVWLVLPLVIWCFALAAARRRGAHAAVRFQTFTGVSVLVAILSVARITPPVFDYLIRWLWVVAMLLSASIAWSLWSAFIAPRTEEMSTKGLNVVARFAPTSLGVCAAIAILVSGSVTVSQIGRTGTPDGDWWVQIEGVAPDTITHTLANTPPGSPVLVRSVGTENGSVADGVRLQLERAGIPVLVDDDLGHTYGTARTLSGRTPAATLLVAMGSSAETMSGNPGLTRIAHWDPMTTSEREAQGNDMAILADQFRAVGRDDLADNIGTGDSLDEAKGLAGIDQHLLESVEKGRRRGDQVAVFRVNDQS